MLYGTGCKNQEKRKGVFPWLGPSRRRKNSCCCLNRSKGILLNKIGKISSQPAVFVIGGGGSGIALYRSLRRKGIAFAAGIIHENDIEYPVIRALASEFVSEKAFEAVSQEKYEKALEIMKNCGNAVCTLKDFGTMNERCRELVYKAEEMGILRGIDVYE